MRLKRLVLSAAGVALWGAPAFGQNEEIRIGNESIERVFTLKGGRLRTQEFVNKLDRRVYAMDSREFELTVAWERLHYEHGTENPVRLTAGDFTCDGFERKALAAGEQVAFHFSNSRYALEVRSVIEAPKDSSFLRKHLEIRASGKARVFVDRIAVEDFELRGLSPRLGGFGQPLYADNLFFGVEYPAGFNLAEGRGVKLLHYSGETAGSEWLVSETAVTGAAKEGAVRAAFLAYIDRIRAAKVRPTVVFNTWYDTQRDGLTEESCRGRMAALNKKLLDPFETRLDSFVLDDGWDDRNSVWEIHPRRFPGGFRDISKALDESGTRLGLWFGPVGGYEERTLRIAAGRRQGYEITGNGEYFCLAGRKYGSRFEQVVLDMVKRYGVNHFKLDGVPYGCNEPGHGHLPGVYASEAHARAFIDLLKKVRTANPEVFLNITTGNWLSPWWLRYTDVVFMGGMDYGFLNDVPAISERDKAITYRDSVLHEDFRKHEYQFPQSSIMTIGIIKGLLGAEGGAQETLASWTHNLIMNFSRGSMLTELYVSPPMLTDAEWDVLGRTMRWARDRSDVLLADTRLILGDPAKGETYGYAHFKGGRGIVTVRNPEIAPRTVRLSLDTDAGVEPQGAAYQARMVYPRRRMLRQQVAYGDSLPLTVEGFGVVVVEFDSAAQAAGTASEAPRPGTPGPGVRALDFSDQGGSFLLKIPAGTENARLALLYKPEGSDSRLNCDVQINGARVQPRVVSPQSSQREFSSGEGRWTFVVVPLEAGENRVSFRAAGFSGELEAWLAADFALEAKDARAPGGNELPANDRVDYRTIPLFTKRFTSSR